VRVLDQSGYVDPSTFAFSLSLHRHSYISLLFKSRFVEKINVKNFSDEIVSGNSVITTLDLSPTSNKNHFVRSASTGVIDISSFCYHETLLCYL